MEPYNAHIMLQQGDLCLTRIPALPFNTSPRQDGVVMTGETTGHAHRIADFAPGLLVEKDGVLYLSTPQTVTITHEEHAPLTVPSGIWRVDRVQEYDYVKKMTRSVLD